MVRMGTGMKPWRGDIIIQRSKVLCPIGTTKAINFMMWLTEQPNMKKEFAVSAVWLYSGLYRWERATKDGVMALVEEIYREEK